MENDDLRHHPHHAYFSCELLSFSEIVFRDSHIRAVGSFVIIIISYFPHGVWFADLFDRAVRALQKRLTPAVVEELCERCGM